MANQEISKNYSNILTEQQLPHLIYYCLNYSETTGSLWFYSKDETTYFNADIVNTNDFKSFKYKDKLIENTVA